MVTSQELQERVAEQRRLLKSVASVGEELLSQQTTPNGDRCVFSSLISSHTYFSLTFLCHYFCKEEFL